MPSTRYISNGWPDLREYLLQCRIEDAFDTVVISAEVGILKPDPKIYQLALQNLGVRAEEAAFGRHFEKEIMRLAHDGTRVQP